MAEIGSLLLFVAEALMVLLGLLLIVARIVMRWDIGWCKSPASMKGKVVVITGASAGIGKETASDLARRGARVIMACRNLQKANKVAEDIRKDTGSDLVEVQLIDTSSMDSVRYFANNFLKKETRLDVLVLNAGIGSPDKFTCTEADHEIGMATNHFGHFLLTNILLDLLKKSAPSRVVVVASLMHRHVKDFDPDDLSNRKRPYIGSLQAYSHSKLCNILFTKQLSHYLEGTGVACNALCPGYVMTEIQFKTRALWTQILGAVVFFAGKSEVEGAQTIIHLAVAEEEAKIKGKFFENCKVSSSSAQSNDMGLAKKVWEKSEELVGLKPEERHY